METSYITSAAEPHQLPVLGLPEIALVGRSNCGKSSLINALLNRTSLARVSSTPGRTQMANFFGVKIGDRRLAVIDLPGYGYSSTSRSTRKPWQDLVQASLIRPSVRECLFLVDARRVVDNFARKKPVLADDDMAVIRLIASRQEVGIVLTKVDKLNQSEVAKGRAAVEQELTKLRISPARVVGVSTLKGTGIDRLREAMLNYMEEVEPGPDYQER